MSEKLLLFDQFQRTDATRAKYTEPLFDALNRLSWNNTAVIRETLEKWFSVYPLKNRAALRSRFRSPRYSDHQGAFFELVLFRLLSELGYNVIVDPLTPSGTPDFLASSIKNGNFYVDATIACPKTFRDSPSEIVFFDELNKLNCPNFWLNIRIRGTLSSMPPMRKTMQDIQTWINELDYERVQADWNGNRRLPSYRFEYLGWILIIEAMPTSPETRKKPHRPIGSGPMRVEFIDSVKPIRNAIHKKANKYKELDAPFIVAVNALDLGGVDRTDILEALFGWESSTNDPDTSRIKAPSGFSKKDCILDSHKNRRVSAVLLFNELQHSSISSACLCLYENPWASQATPVALRRIPHGLVEGELLRWHSGDSLGNILHLPLDWPGPK